MKNEMWILVVGSALEPLSPLKLLHKPACGPCYPARFNLTSPQPRLTSNVINKLFTLPLNINLHLSSTKHLA